MGSSSAADDLFCRQRGKPAIGPTRTTWNDAIAENTSPSLRNYATGHRARVNRVVRGENRILSGKFMHVAGPSSVPRTQQHGTRN
jgi:hypothetical protein